MGDVSGVNDDPRKELIMGWEETTLAQKSTMLDRMDQNSINGLNIVGQDINDNSGPLEQLMEKNYRPDADLGRTPSGISFKMGLTSPKLSKSHKIKKATEGGQKKNKENRGGVGTRKGSNRECMQAQEVDSGIGRSMEVDQAEMGLKRRTRSPLHELENFDVSGKRARMEGEVREFGKLLAHHLGSAEAGNQLRRTQ